MLKSLLPVCLILIISSCSITAVTPNKTGELNPYLEHMRKGISNGTINVTIFDKPQENHHECQPEWGIHKTYCESKSLASFSIEDKRVLLESYKNITRIGFMLATTFKELEKICKSSLTKLAYNFFTPATKILVNSFKNGTFDVLAAQANEILSLPTFNKSLEQCWIEHLSVLRSSALCSACSGRNHQFFNGSKGIIDQSTCDSALAKCKPSFNTIFKIIIEIEKALKFVEAFTYEKVSFTIKDFGTIRTSYQIFKTLANSVRQSNVMVLMAELGSSSIPNNNLTSTRLCSILLNLNELSFLQITAEQLTRAEPHIEKVFPLAVSHVIAATVSYQKSLIKLPTLFSNFRFKRRLQADSSLTLNSGFLVGDVQVQSATDSSYASFFGATGSSGNEASVSVHSSPMNLTMHYL